jgi:glutathione S-transferase
MADGREFIAGDNISLADILLFCFLTFAGAVGQPYDQNLANIHSWFERMSARPSAQA